LGFIERNAVLFLVLNILIVVPFKVQRSHGANVIQSPAIVNGLGGAAKTDGVTHNFHFG
jgi:hypothetical protein